MVPTGWMPGQGSGHGVEGTEAQQHKRLLGTSGVALIQHKYPFSNGWSLRRRDSAVLGTQLGPRVVLGQTREELGTARPTPRGGKGPHGVCMGQAQRG